MFIDTNFTFNNLKAEEDFGLRIVRMSGGMVQQAFTGSRKILEEKVNGEDRPIFYGIDRDPLSFSLMLSKEGIWTEQDKKDIMDWLLHDDYKDFESEETSLIFSVIVVGQPTFSNNTDDRGYLEVDFRCDSAFGYEPFESQQFNMSANIPEGTNQTINNPSNIGKPYYPIVEVELVAGTSFHITNTTNESEIYMDGLTTGEIIEIDCKRKIVLSSTANNRLENLRNLEFLSLVYGDNTLNIKGDVIFKIRCRYPVAL